MAADKAARDHNRHVVLLYAYWEPKDAHRYGIFSVHSARVRELFEPLGSDRVTALSMSYQQLWNHWQNVAVPHIGQLRQRYNVSLKDSPKPCGGRWLVGS